MISTELRKMHILVAKGDICQRDMVTGSLQPLLRVLGVDVQFTSVNTARGALEQLGDEMLGMRNRASSLPHAVILDQLHGRHLDVARSATTLGIPLLYHVGDPKFAEQINNGAFAFSHEMQVLPDALIAAYPNSGRDHLAGLAVAASRLLTPTTQI